MRPCALLAWLALATPALAAEAERPLLELGAVAIGGTFPDYPAADQNHWQGAPLPYVIYRGDILRSDESGIRGELLRGERVQLDVSLNGSLPVDSSDNDAREDMPDLDLMGEIGPNLRFILLREPEVRRLDLDIGLRAAFTTDFSSIDHRGFVLAPELSYKRLGLGLPDSRLRLGLGPVFGTERYMDYFYEVEPRYARPGRPAYDADAGYLGTRLQGSYRLSLGQRLSVVAGGRAEGFWGAINDDSPLFRRNVNLAALLGVSYSFYQSDARARVSYDPLD
ncbi:MAG TPA: MipA/OmpV family protein [Geminicoccaceae bacterium]|nr:MipA/OmpV family protein [Geminicoccus sp.]HMU51246.1 MipA/OmpV family protein [Geminicoccaceae bacterium]